MEEFDEEFVETVQQVSSRLFLFFQNLNILNICTVFDSFLLFRMMLETYEIAQP